MGSEKRQRSKHIMVRVSPDELALLNNLASQCDLSVPAYLRTLGLGHTPTSTVDHQAVLALAHLHADLGRVGGLFKLWLSNDERQGFGEHLNIKQAMADLKQLQTLITDQVTAI